MIAQHPECDDRRLAGILNETLSDRQQAAATGHLDRCPRCRERLEEMVADASWWSEPREVLGSHDTESNSNDPVNSNDSNDALDSGRGRERHPLVPDVMRGAKQRCPDGDAEGQREDAHTAWVMRLLQPTSEPDTMGDLDHFPIHAVIGQGGMGVVLKARDPSLPRFLAIKLLSPMLASAGAARQRFFREARAAASVVHPNIVPIHAISGEREIPYLVMPYVAGGNLQWTLDVEGPLPLDRTLAIGLQVAEALVAAHGQGIVHRDIKPANLLLDEGGFRVLLSDFGLARVLDDATLTGSGLLAGTPQYMSPEQARGGAIDHRTDIYSLGAVLYAMATGRAPIRGASTMEILRRIGEEPPKPVTQINECYPKWYDELVRRLMEPDPERRVTTAADVVKLLRACLAHARSPFHAPLPPTLRPRRRRLIATLGGTATLGAAAILWSCWPSISSSHDPLKDAPMPRPNWASEAPMASAASSAFLPEAAIGHADVEGESWNASDVDALLQQAEVEVAALLREINGVGSRP